jgi:hypothetical protein
MSKEIKINLSDAQADALAREAEGAGLKFFDHCRAKLMAGIGQPARIERQPASRALVTKSVEPMDRIDRLEAMMAQLAGAIERIGAPVDPYADGQPEEPEVAVDTDDMISRALGEAERQGLMVDREAPAPTSGGVRHVGHRPPSRYSVGGQPRHLNDAFRS